MSNTQGAFDNAQGGFGNANAGGFGGGPWARGCSTSRWTPVELLAMVLGFMVFWPIGLAVLAFKYWQRKTGGADLQTVATGAYQRARSAMGGFPSAPAASRQSWTQPWAHGFAASSGNAAFDDWKRTELQRLEEERRRLDNAHREFADWLDTVRKAKDREEFDRFMNERRAKGV